MIIELQIWIMVIGQLHIMIVMALQKIGLFVLLFLSLAGTVSKLNWSLSKFLDFYYYACKT